MVSLDGFKYRSRTYWLLSALNPMFILVIHPSPEPFHQTELQIAVQIRRRYDRGGNVGHSSALVEKSNHTGHPYHYWHHHRISSFQRWVLHDGADINSSVLRFLS